MCVHRQLSITLSLYPNVRVNVMDGVSAKEQWDANWSRLDRLINDNNMSEYYPCSIFLPLLFYDLFVQLDRIYPLQCIANSIMECY